MSNNLIAYKHHVDFFDRTREYSDTIVEENGMYYNEMEGASNSPCGDGCKYTGWTKQKIRLSPLEMLAYLHDNGFYRKHKQMSKEFWGEECQ